MKGPSPSVGQETLQEATKKSLLLLETLLWPPGLWKFIRQLCLNNDPAAREGLLPESVV